MHIPVRISNVSVPTEAGTRTIHAERGERGERERERERRAGRERNKYITGRFWISEFRPNLVAEWTGFEYVFPWVGLDPPFSLVLLSCVFPPKIPRVSRSIFDLAPCGSGILSRFAYESFFAIAEFCKHAGFCRCISESPYNSIDYVIHLDGFQYLFSTSVLNRVI